MHPGTVAVVVVDGLIVTISSVVVVLVVVVVVRSMQVGQHLPSAGLIVIIFFGHCSHIWIETIALPSSSIVHFLQGCEANFKHGFGTHVWQHLPSAGFIVIISFEQASHV